MARRLLLAGVAALLAGGVALYVVRGAGDAAPAAANPAPQALEFLPSDLYTVRREPLERTLPLTGTLRPLLEAEVRAKTAGQVLEVTVREGEAVKEGQVLARIDPTELRARVAGREAELAAARSQLALANKTLEQQRALANQGFISKNALLNAESSFEVAQARVGTARAELAVAREALENAVLRAPFAGSVAARLADPGERVAVDAPVLRIVDLTRLALEVNVPAENIGEVRIGQPLTFRVQGFGERRFTGAVERINPTTSEGTRSIPVHVVVRNDDRTLRAGLFVTASLVLERVEDALPIPATAVREEDGRRYVYAIEDETVRRRPVETGIATRSGLVEVRNGLQAGDVIVRNNLGQLRDGAAARVTMVAAQAYR